MSIVTDFFSQTRGLHQSEIGWLLQQGVPPLALARDPGEIGFALGATKVVFENGYFDFSGADEALSAFCIVVRDEVGAPADLVAWRPRGGILAPHLGAVSLVGEQRVLTSRLGEPLPVHRDLLGWLKADRDGVVVLNPFRALSLLSYASALQAEDLEHGLVLRDSLQPPELNILIPNNHSVAA